MTFHQGTIEILNPRILRTSAIPRFLSLPALEEPCMSLHFVTTVLRRGLTLISNTVVLGILLGLLWWGRAYKWKVPSFAVLTGTAETEEGGKVESPSRGGRGTEVSKISPGNPALEGAEPPLYQVRLATPETVRKAGIDAEAAEERALAQYVTANGAIEFDQTRINAGLADGF